MIEESQQLLIPYKEYKREELVDIPGIYCFYNTINGKVYIGQANNIGYRIQCHLANLDDGLYFHNSLKKYGYDNFKLYLLERFLYINKDEQNKSEIYFVSKFKSDNPKFGYNLTKGGEGHLGIPLTEEVKLKIKERHKCPCFGYNYISKEYFEADDAKIMTELLNERGFNNIRYANVRNAANGGQSYTDDFLFARSIEDLQNKIKTFTPQTHLKVYLYNYKQHGDIMEFDSPAEVDRYIKSCGYNISNGHSYTALTKNNKRIKDFLIASSKTELLKLIENNPYIIYFYNIENKFILTFESNSQALKVLKSLGFKTNETSLSKCKLGTQRQTAGFIIGRSKEELLKRVENYAKETIQSTINYIKEYNLQDSQDTLNWMDDLNKLSVEF